MNNRQDPFKLIPCKEILLPTDSTTWNGIEVIPLKGSRAFIKHTYQSDNRWWCRMYIYDVKSESAAIALPTSVKIDDKSVYLQQLVIRRNSQFGSRKKVEAAPGGVAELTNGNLLLSYYDENDSPNTVLWEPKTDRYFDMFNHGFKKLIELDNNRYVILHEDFIKLFTYEIRDSQLLVTHLETIYAHAPSPLDEKRNNEKPKFESLVALSGSSLAVYKTDSVRVSDYKHETAIHFYRCQNDCLIKEKEISANFFGEVDPLYFLPKRHMLLVMPKGLDNIEGFDIRNKEMVFLPWWLSDSDFGLKMPMHDQRTLLLQRQTLFYSLDIYNPKLQKLPDDLGIKLDYTSNCTVLETGEVIVSSSHSYDAPKIHVLASEKMLKLERKKEIDAIKQQVEPCRSLTGFPPGVAKLIANFACHLSKLDKKPDSNDAGNVEADKSAVAPEVSSNIIKHSIDGLVSFP